MLTARLTQEFREFDIVETLASPSIKSDELKAKGIDLIISTIAGVDFDIPSIVVTPILSKKDIQIITDYISKIDIKLVEPDEIIEKQDAILDAKDPRGKISEINLYSSKVLSIIDNVDYKELALSTIDDAIEDYSSMFDDKIAKNTRHALRKREKIGSTIIRKQNILLLHAKVKNFEQVKVAVLNPKHEIRYKDALIKSIVVLLIDKKAADIEIELVSQVSKNLIVNEKFINAVKSLDKSLFVQEMSNIMYNFLYNKFTREVD
jgi:hypothetical protein